MVKALVIPTAEGEPITEYEANKLEDYQAVVGGWIEPVDIPALGRYPLAFHPVGQEILAGLFTLPNWHLLWYLAPLVAIVRWRVFGRVPAARFLGLALLLFLAFLAVNTSVSAFAAAWVSRS